MSSQNILTVYRKELREALRDRRTIVSSLLVPLLLFPVLTAGLGAGVSVLIGQAKAEIRKVMVIGGEASPNLLEDLHGMKKIEIVPLAANWKEQIVDKEIRAAVDIPVGFKNDLVQQKVTTLKIYNYDGDLKSSLAADTIQKHLETYRTGVVKESLAAKNLPDAAL